MIKIENVSKQFSNTTVLNEISLEFHDGTVTGIVGANGSGKTTLMRLLSSIIMPTSGDIWVDGANSKTATNESKSKIGLLLGGDTALYDRLTAYENIYFQAMLQGLSPQMARERIDELTALFHMEKYIQKQVGNFSRGMRQKVCFSKAIVHNPSILLLDEPSTGLDIDSILEIHDFILLCKEMGKTVLISSHNMNELEKLCDYVALLQNGKIVLSGNVQDIKKSQNISSIEQMYRKYISSSDTQGVNHL